MRYVVKKSQFVSRHCIVCGTENPCGFKAKFYETEDNEVITIFRTTQSFQGFPGMLHGGVSAMILDEIMSRAIMLHDGEYTLGLTIEQKTRYKKVLPMDVELKAIGRITRNTRVVFEGSAEIFLPDGTIAVTSTAKYVKKNLSGQSNDDFIRNHWRAPEEAPPSEISF